MVKFHCFRYKLVDFVHFSSRQNIFSWFLKEEVLILGMGRGAYNRGNTVIFIENLIILQLFCDKYRKKDPSSNP